MPSRFLRGALLTAACALALASVLWKVRSDRVQRGALEKVVQSIAASGASTETLITDKEEFLWLQVYARDTLGQARVAWVADLGREIAASKSDNIDRTMLNLKLTAGLPVLAYEQATETPSDLQVVVSEKTEPVNWLPGALIASGRQLTLTGTVGDDRVYRIASR